MSKNIRKRRDKLWREKEGKCYWCGKSTKLPPRGTSRAMPQHDFATLDHLRSRFHMERQEPNSTNEERTVLACWTCNNYRGRLEQTACQPLDLKVEAKNFHLR